MFAHIPSPSALRTFEAAARLGSFKAAARELSVTPTAVSHQIRNLEEHLEVPLFIRRTRAVALTESGQRLSEAVHQAFQQIAMALEDVAATETVLTVSTTPAFAALWLVPRLGRFEERHPRLRVQLVSSTTPTDLERDRVADVAVRYGTGPYPRLRAHTFADEAFGAYATPDYIERLERWDDAELIETAWQMPGFEDVSWDAWLAAAGLPRPAKPRARRFDQEHHVVQAGLASQGLVLASSLLVGDLVGRGWLAPYRPETRIAGRRYSALSLPSRASSRKVSSFLEWLEEEATRDASAGRRTISDDS
ncbi:MAG: LysR family transcriptional regulator [Myxococcales bacterium]|nr:LysR family transcriptional regulator [Myxococcales bacterium]